MKKAEILKRVVALPLIIGVVLGIIFFVGFHNGSSKIFSLAEDIAIAYHDNLDEAEGALAGILVVDGEEIAIKYDSSYSNFATDLVISNVGNGFDEIGCVYLQCSNKVFESASSSQIEILFNGKDLKYKLIDKLDGKTEYEATHYSPNAPKSVVIYCQGARDGGILSTFNVLAFEEVE